MTRLRLARIPVWSIVVLAVVLRVALIFRGGAFFRDPDNYMPLAQSLAAGRGFTLNGRPTAYRPPLYPLLLSVVASTPGDSAVFGLIFLHVTLGGATVWLTALAARRVGLSPPRTTVAAFIAACDPVLVLQGYFVMTETPAAFLVAAALAGLTFERWKGPLLGGLPFGLAGLCRPSLLAPAALTVLASAVFGPGGRLERLARSALLAAVISLVMSPWMIRNLLVFGEPIWTTTHGGYTLALANNPVYYRDVLNSAESRVWTGDDQFRWWDSVNRDLAGMTEPEADRTLNRRVWKLARDQPKLFAKACLARLMHFWSVVPASAVYLPPALILSAAWFIPLWVALAAGCVRPELWRWPAVASACAIVGLTLVHTVYWTDMRMRAPIVPAIAIIAAGAALPRFARRSTKPR